MDVATEEFAQPVAKPDPQRVKPVRKRRKKKPPAPWIQHLGGWAAATLVRGLMGTLDCQAEISDPAVDPQSERFAGPVIYVVWHEYLLLPLYLRGPDRIATIASRHRDAEWISRAAERLGYEIVRGSPKSGGQKALLSLLRGEHDRSLAITCDGPRGPRRKMALGAVFLSSRLQIPLVGLGIGLQNPWRANSWDRFAIPRPWSRARVVTMDPQVVPADAERAELEAFREAFEAKLGIATIDAEAWAESGERRPRQVALRRRSKGPRRP